MRRIINDTTAIAACIALLMPQIAGAEPRATNDHAAKRAPTRAEAMPNLSAILQAELAAGLTAEGLICANGDPRPCPNAVRLLTPRGVAVQVARNGRIILAPKAQQVNLANDKGGPRGDQNRQGRSGGERANRPVVADRSGADRRPEHPAATDARRAARQTEQRRADRPAARTKEANQSTEAALAAALAAEQQKGDPAGRPVVAGGRADARPDRLQLSQGGEALARLDRMPGLAEVLRREVRDGLTLNDLKCETGEARPCPAGIALMTPRGIGVVEHDGQLTLLPRARQPNRVNAEGKVIPRAPEADTVETAAAKEAARAASSPAAAALNATEGQGRMIEEEKVTQENTRSSAEDFEASLRAALEQAGKPAVEQGDRGGRNAAAKDDDDDNDLAKALILGLGAVAVGQMLNNNRQVALSAPDRVVIQRPDGSQEVIKDEVALLREPGSTVTTEDFDDGSSRTVVTRADGSKVVTIRDANLQVLRRTLISADGKTTQLIDETADVQPVDIASLPEPAPVQTDTGTLSEEELRLALQREANIDRRFTLGQIRNIPEVRALVAPVNIDAITFDTGSAAIRPDQARQLASLGRVIQDAISRNPQEIFMVEGYTDTVGSDAMNLALSDRRAESVALALSEYFDVPPENLVVQGYGEQFLKVRSEGDIRTNRRASLRRITDLLRTAQVN